MKLFGLVGLLGLALATESNAENYLVSIGSDFETQIFVDTKRIMVKPTEIMAWILTIQIGQDSTKYSRSLEKYDCKQRQSTIVSYTLYDADGKLLTSFEGDGKMKYAVPDTIGEATLDFICAPAVSRAALAKKLASESLSQTIKAAEYFYNNQSTLTPHKSSVQSPKVKFLISQWSELNGKCRGGSAPATVDKVCGEREAIGEKLEKLGWCYGEFAEFAYQSVWARCGNKP